MKKIIFIALISVPFLAKSQILPKERYYICDKPIAGSMTTTNYADYKKSSLYFNDKVAIVSIDGLSKTPIVFHIWSKKFNSDRDLVMECFSDAVYKANKDSTVLSHMPRTVTITIDTLTTYNYKPNTTISFLFFERGLTINFFNSKSAQKNLPLIRQKYFTILNANSDLVH